MALAFDFWVVARPEFSMDIHHGTTEPGYNVYLSIGFDGSGRSQVPKKLAKNGWGDERRDDAETEGYIGEYLKVYFC